MSTYPTCVVIASPILGYYVSLCMHGLFTCCGGLYCNFISQLPKVGVKFSLLAGILLVGGSFIIFAYVKHAYTCLSICAGVYVSCHVHFMQVPPLANGNSLHRFLLFIGVRWWHRERHVADFNLRPSGHPVQWTLRSGDGK